MRVVTDSHKNNIYLLTLMTIKSFYIDSLNARSEFDGNCFVHTNIQSHKPCMFVAETMATHQLGSGSVVLVLQ